MFFYFFIVNRSEELIFSSFEDYNCNRALNFKMDLINVNKYKEFEDYNNNRATVIERV